MERRLQFQSAHNDLQQWDETSITFHKKKGESLALAFSFKNSTSPIQEAGGQWMPVSLESIDVGENAGGFLRNKHGEWFFK